MNAGATWLDSSQQLLPGLPVTDLAGTIFRPPHFRARGGLTLSDKAFPPAAFPNQSATVTDNRRPARNGRAPGREGGGRNVRVRGVAGQYKKKKKHNG